MSNVAAGTDGLASSKARFLTCAGGSSMSNVAIKFSHAGPSQGALPLAGRGRRITSMNGYGFLWFSIFRKITVKKALLNEAIG